MNTQESWDNLSGQHAVLGIDRRHVRRRSRGFPVLGLVGLLVWFLAASAPVFSQSERTGSTWRLGAAPAVSLPISYSADTFGVGYGATVDGGVSLGNVPWLEVVASGEYTRHSIASDLSFQMMSGHLGVRLVAFPRSRFSLGAGGFVGAYQGTLSGNASARGAGLSYRAGGSARYQLTSRLGLTAGADEPIVHTETLETYDRNALRWDDDRKVAAFVTAKDHRSSNSQKRGCYRPATLGGCGESEPATGHGGVHCAH